MDIAIILLFAIFIVPIIIGIFTLRRSRKIATVLISIPFIFIIAVLGWWFYETNHRFTGSTELIEEQIGDFAIDDAMTEEIFDQLGLYDELDDPNYDELFVFDGVDIGTSIHERIIFIETRAAQMPTSKGLKVGDSVEEIKKTYGDKFYKSSNFGMGETINYVDRNRKLHLQFWIEDDQINKITLKAI